jgi:hypothetical protein
MENKLFKFIRELELTEIETDYPYEVEFIYDEDGNVIDMVPEKEVIE